MSVNAIATAGDTFTATESLPAYPAGSGWVAKLRLAARSGAGTPIELTAAASGDDHVFTAAASTTAAWPPGEYSSVLWVEKAAEKYTIRQGQVSILPDPRTIGAGTDTRSLARRTLADLQAARAAWAVSQGRTRRYKIADREREFASAAELNQELAYWEAQVASEDAAARLVAGLGSKNRILTRFVRPR